jgi:hypothetical protein
MQGAFEPTIGPLRVFVGHDGWRWEWLCAATPKNLRGVKSLPPFGVKSRGLAPRILAEPAGVEAHERGFGARNYT